MLDQIMSWRRQSKIRRFLDIAKRLLGLVLLGRDGSLAVFVDTRKDDLLYD